MKFTKKTNSPEPDLKNNFDALCQSFEGGHFYGLEYVLDDFFQNTTVKHPEPVKSEIDWFGLYH
jgi:hypothetical protein